MNLWNYKTSSQLGLLQKIDLVETWDTFILFQNQNNSKHRFLHAIFLPHLLNFLSVTEKVIIRKRTVERTKRWWGSQSNNASATELSGFRVKQPRRLRDPEMDLSVKLQKVHRNQRSHDWQFDTQSESLFSDNEKWKFKAWICTLFGAPPKTMKKKCNSNYSKIIMLQEKQTLFG